MLKRCWQVAALTCTIAMVAAGPARAQSSAVSAQESSDLRELRERVQVLQRSAAGRESRQERQEFTSAIVHVRHTEGQGTRADGDRKDVA